MIYNLHAYSSVEYDIRAIPKPDQGKIREAINSLAENPRPSGVIKMTGYANAYRIRVGGYRIVYQVSDQELIVLVVAAATRDKIYSLFKRRLKSGV